MRKYLILLKSISLFVAIHFYGQIYGATTDTIPPRHKVTLPQAHIGDLKRVPAFLKSYGAEDVPTPEVLRKWRQRGVPDKAIVSLLAFLEIETGRPISLAKFLEE